MKYIGGKKYNIVKEYFRTCLNFIANFFYSYFQMDFVLFTCRFSGLNQQAKRIKYAEKSMKKLLRSFFSNPIIIFFDKIQTVSQMSQIWF
jgi:hypothetical protein